MLLCLCLFVFTFLSLERKLIYPRIKRYYDVRMAVNTFLFGYYLSVLYVNTNTASGYTRNNLFFLLFFFCFYSAYAAGLGLLCMCGNMMGQCGNDFHSRQEYELSARQNDLSAHELQFNRIEYLFMRVYMAIIEDDSWLNRDPGKMVCQYLSQVYC